MEVIMPTRRCNALLLNDGMARRCTLRHAHGLEEEHRWELLDRDHYLFGEDNAAGASCRVSTLLNYIQDWVARPDRKIRVEIHYDYNHDRVVITGDSQPDGGTKYTLRLSSWREDE
jgi:hypothetical protein